MAEILVQPCPARAALARHPHLLVLSGALAALLTGALMAACFHPFDLHWLAWIALVPWLLLLPRFTVQRVTLLGFLVGLAYYGIGAAWLYGVAGLFGAIVIFWLALLLAVPFRVARLLIERFGPVAMLWAVPLAYVGLEVLRSEAHSHVRFAFLAFGYSQARNLWIAQVASLGGVYFLTFLLVAVNTAVAYALIRRRLFGWLPALATVGGVLVLAALAQPGSYTDRAVVPVACVQNETCGYMQYYKDVERALAGRPRPAFTVLPEHGLLDIRAQDPEVAALGELARRHNVYILAAGDRRAAAGAACSFDNVAMLLGPQGQALEQRKAVPIPFFKDGNPATRQAVAATPYGRVGVCICYDATFTDVPRRLADLGAELLLVPVMDPAPWPAQERWQHADLAVFRAIELRRCVVRAASSGISQVIDATGCVRAQRTGRQGPGLLQGEVYFSDERTLFARIGWLFGPATCLLLLLAVVLLTAIQWQAQLRAWRHRLGRAATRSLSADPLSLLVG